MTPGKDKLLLKGCKKGNNIQILHRFCIGCVVPIIVLLLDLETYVAL